MVDNKAGFLKRQNRIMVQKVKDHPQKGRRKEIKMNADEDGVNT